MILNNSYFDNDNYIKDEYDHNNISLNSDKRNNNIEGEYFDYNIGNNILEWRYRNEIRNRS